MIAIESPPKIGIVDSSADMVALLREELQLCGIGVGMTFTDSIGKSTDRLISAFNRETPDIVLVDIEPPYQGNLSAARKLQAALPATQLILMTTGAEFLDSLVSQSGETAMLAKPFACDDLVSAVLKAWASRLNARPA